MPPRKNFSGGLKLKVDASGLGNIDLSAIANHFAMNAEKAFREDIGPEFVKTAKARAPVGQQHVPRPSSKSFQPVGLRPARELAGGRSKTAREARSRRAELEAILAESRGSARVEDLRSSDVELFRFTEGENKGESPDIIDVRRGGLVGAKLHKPGTLRDSIHVRSVVRSGNRVTLTVAAEAPYALPVHEGFTHRGGSKHEGKSTRIKGQKFLISPLVNARERLLNPKTYTG